MGSLIPQLCCLRCLWSLLGQSLVPTAFISEHPTLLASLPSGDPLPGNLYLLNSTQWLLKASVQESWTLGTNFHSLLHLANVDATAKFDCQFQMKSGILRPPLCALGAGKTSPYLRVFQQGTLKGLLGHSLGTLLSDEFAFLYPGALISIGTVPTVPVQGLKKLE